MLREVHRPCHRPPSHCLKLCREPRYTVEQALLGERLADAADELSFAAAVLAFVVVGGCSRLVR